MARDLGQKGKDLYSFLDVQTQNFSPVPDVSDTKSKFEYFRACFSLRMPTGHFLMSVPLQFM